MSRPVMQDIALHEVILTSDVAGCPQTFLRSEYVAYAQKGEPVQAIQEGHQAAATLVPTGAVVLAFVVDRDGNTFVWKDGLFAARSDYSMEHFVGADSIVYGFAARAADGRVVVRLFDAVKLRGVSLVDMDCFGRFGRLWEGISATSRSRSSIVRTHWVWSEAWVTSEVLCKPDENAHGLDCAWQYAVRLPQLLSAEAKYHVLELGA